MRMLRLLFTLLMMAFLSTRAFAQLGGLKDRVYGYDAAGNRIIRQQMSDGGGGGDGTARPIFSASPTTADSLIVWPNPVTETLNLELPSDCITVLLCDISGKVFLNVPAKVYSIDVSSIPVGTYLVIAVNPEGKRQTRKVVIQH